MREGIEKRELIVLHGLGLRLQGTYHRPSGGLTVASAAGERVGVLFVNSLSLPRAASGDSAVHWAEAIAEMGYPSIRIDLPGLGDSGGEASTDLLDRINAGEFAAVTTAVIHELVERFGLTGVVVFGHCAGSVSAVFAGSEARECKGLILLDPYFHVPQAKRPQVREELSAWARRSKVGRVLSNLYDRAKNLRKLLRGNSLPGNANKELLARWKQIASAGMPVLLLKAPGIKAQGAKPRLGEFDYVEHVVKMAGRQGSIAVEFVEGADHSFANRAGRDAVRRHMDVWLSAHFPKSRVDGTGVKAVPDDAHGEPSHETESRTEAADRYCSVESR